jgi:hypothetical protein
MQTTKKALTTVALAGALTFTGTGIAQAAHEQNAVALGGLVAAAINADRTIDIDRIEILTNDGEIRIIDDINISDNNVLNGLDIRALNNIDIRDAVDVVIVGNNTFLDVL